MEILGDTAQVRSTHVPDPPPPDNHLDARAVRRRAHRLRAFRSNLFGNSADEYLKGLGAFMRAVTELFGPEQAGRGLGR